MSFRARIALLTAVAIAVTVAGASIAVWMIAKHELYSQLDSTLFFQAKSGREGPVRRRQRPDRGDQPGRRPPRAAVHPGHRARRSRSRTGPPDGYYANTTIQGVPVRELVAARAGRRRRRSRSLRSQPTTHALHRIRFWIILVGGIGIALAAGLAALVATAALRPVRRLTAAAENVAATGEPDRACRGRPVDDELGRLATQFNAMLTALESSVGAQRRLVADASHELRTPLTAVRTNIDLLREGKLPAEEARHALDEASVELDALTRLVSDLVELARGEERKLRLEDVQLDDLVAACGRARAGAGAAGDASSPRSRRRR